MPEDMKVRLKRFYPVLQLKAARSEASRNGEEMFVLLEKTEKLGVRRAKRAAWEGLCMTLFSSSVLLAHTVHGAHRRSAQALHSPAHYGMDSWFSKHSFFG